MNSFIFSLNGNKQIVDKYKEKNPLYVPIRVSGHAHALYGWSNYIVSYGDGSDIFCGDDCDKTANAYTNFPYSYGLPKWGTDTSNRKYLLGGYSKPFKVNEIEIYKME